MRKPTRADSDAARESPLAPPRANPMKAGLVAVADPAVERHAAAVHLDVDALGGQRRVIHERLECGAQLCVAARAIVDLEQVDEGAGPAALAAAFAAVARTSRSDTV